MRHLHLCAVFHPTLPTAARAAFPRPTGAVDADVRQGVEEAHLVIGGGITWTLQGILAGLYPQRDPLIPLRFSIPIVRRPRSPDPQDRTAPPGQTSPLGFRPARDGRSVGIAMFAARHPTNGTWRAGVDPPAQPASIVSLSATRWAFCSHGPRARRPGFERSPAACFT